MQCTRTLGDFPYSYCLYWFGPGEAVKDRYQPKLLENPIPLLLLLVAMDAHRLIPSKVKTFILCSIKLEWEIDKIMISLTHAVAYSWSDHRTCAWSRWRPTPARACESPERQRKAHVKESITLGNIRTEGTCYSFFSEWGRMGNRWG